MKKRESRGFLINQTGQPGQAGMSFISVIMLKTNDPSHVKERLFDGISAGMEGGDLLFQDLFSSISAINLVYNFMCADLPVHAVGELISVDRSSSHSVAKSRP